MNPNGETGYYSEKLISETDYSHGAEGGPVCNFMSPNFDS